MVVILLCFVTHLQAENIFAFQPDKIDTKQLLKLFTEAVGQDFAIVKDILNTRPVARGGETYWLVHVKPKRTGHYAIKYTFKYTHKFSHPEEGENELYIRVGEKNCSRYNNNNLGIGNVCLGDTVIVPIRLDQVTGHQFSLKSTYQDGENIGKEQSSSTSSFSDIEQINNPLEKQLKYLGTQRYVMPHRNYGVRTVAYTAYFQAQSVGKFNLALSKSFGDETADKSIKINPLDGLPIIIVNLGNPITALVYHENTINYSDNKRFSSHAGHDFLTKLLILQPGDVFGVEYSRYVENEEKREKILDLPKSENKIEPKLQIHKLPFTVNKDWSYNEWLIDYLPKEN